MADPETPPRSNFHGVHYMPKPGDPDYISIAESVSHHMLRKAEYNALPSTIERRAREAADDARIAAEKAAKLKKPVVEYPWLKEDWVEAPVRSRAPTSARHRGR